MIFESDSAKLSHQRYHQKNGIAMLIHYCVIAFKNIWKYKVSASISILGLAFALVCFVPILYWMDHETTYDSFYKDSESIYRVYSVEKQSGKVNKGASKGIENSLRAVSYTHLRAHET